MEFMFLDGGEEGVDRYTIVIEWDEKDYDYPES